MTPINHLAPKGSHVPLIEYIGTPPERLGRREGPKSFTRGAKDDRPASVVIEEEIEAVMKNYDFISLAQVRMARIAFCRYMMRKYRVRFFYRQACMFFPSPNLPS